MTDKLYLIAHKVRGETAFDIAIQMEMPDGIWWIIPTSGHRAYPYWHDNLESVYVLENIPPAPDDLRDHYTAVEAYRQPKVQLGLDELEALIGDEL